MARNYDQMEPEENWAGVKRGTAASYAGKCENCRFWSQMCAQSIGYGPVEALCLAPNGPHHGKYKGSNDRCPSWKINTHGAWDEPPDYGETARTAYEAEEQTGDLP